ncbi:hypothetical protein BDW68DRAFT_66468 [Aspergillus falconensis]
MHTQPDVEYAYYYEERNNNIGFPLGEEDTIQDWELPYIPEAPAGARKHDEQAEDWGPELDTDPRPWPLNDTFQVKLGHDKRQANSHMARRTPYWSPSQVSLPKDSTWGSPSSGSFDPATPNRLKKYAYHYDTAAADDQYVYMLFDKGIWSSHPVRSQTRSSVCLSADRFGCRSSAAGTLST